MPLPHNSQSEGGKSFFSKDQDTFVTLPTEERKEVQGELGKFFGEYRVIGDSFRFLKDLVEKIGIDDVLDLLREKEIKISPQGHIEKLKLNTIVIDELPEFPDTLKELYLLKLNIRSIPNFPVSLEKIYIDVVPIYSLPTLPSSLKEFYCLFSNISQLPELPENLELLDCEGSLFIDKLPNLPDTITNLGLRHTGIKSLDTSKLPKNLKILDIRETDLTAVVGDEKKIRDFCREHNITFI